MSVEVYTVLLYYHFPQYLTNVQCQLIDYL